MDIYISGTVETLNSTDFLKIDGKIVPIISATDEVEWGGSEEWWLKGYCTEPGRKKCFAWICYGVENLKRANQLDKKIDIEDSLTNGDFRCQTISGNTACFYKVMSIKFLQ